MKRHIVAENCTEEVTGGYDTVNNQIVVCHNRVYTEEMTQAVIAHEMIHMFDHCRAKFDFTNLEHIACSEVGRVGSGPRIQTLFLTVVSLFVDSRR